MAEEREKDANKEEAPKPLSRTDVRGIVQASIAKLRETEIAGLSSAVGELRVELAALAPALGREEVAEMVRNAVEALRGEQAPALGRAEIEEMVRSAVGGLRATFVTPTPAPSQGPTVAQPIAQTRITVGGEQASATRATIPASALPPGAKPRQEPQPQRVEETPQFDHPVPAAPVESQPAEAATPGQGAALVNILNSVYGNLEKAQRAALALPEGEERELVLSRITALRRGVAEAAKPFTS